MTIRYVGTLLLAAALLMGAGCGGDEEATNDGPPAAAEPTQDGLVATLRSFLAAIESGDLDAAAVHMHPFPGMGPDDVEKALPGFIEKREISGPGIDILAAKGKYGPLVEVFPGRGESWAGKVGADPAACYALSYEGAEVGALWNGKAFLLLRLDDVGKLE